MTTSPTLQDGAELKRLRVEAGIKRGRLAERAGLHRTYIRLLELEQRSAAPETLAVIAGVIGCPLRDVVRKGQQVA